MTQLYAQPYLFTATGFYFDSIEDFAAKAAATIKKYGEHFEEFAIQFIDGEYIDCALAQAICINQANLAQYFECVENWDDHDKTKVIIAVGECGYRFEANTSPDDFEVDIYHVETLKELAEQFVDEGLFGDIPEPLQFYIDHEAIARDLAVEYTSADIAGQRLIYRAA